MPSPRIKTKAGRAAPASGKRARHAFGIKRVYDDSSPGEGLRFLVDRLWPRGIKKSALSSAVWLKEVAPSPALRQWFGHDPAKWTEFRKRYRRELEKDPAAAKPLRDAIKKGDVTLLFGARDREINHAVVLRDFLEGR